jgi:hypothetical protein
MEVLGMKKIVSKIHKGAYQCETVEFSDMNVELSELNDPAPPSVQTCFTVGEWIAVAYSNKWHPGMAIAMSPQKHSITIRFLDAIGKNRFRFPRKDDTDILNGRTRRKLPQHLCFNDRRKTYRLSEFDYELACDLFYRSN